MQRVDEPRSVLTIVAGLVLALGACFSEDPVTSETANEGDSAETGSASSGEPDACDGESCSACRACVGEEGGTCEAEQQACDDSNFCTALFACIDTCDAPECLTGCCEQSIFEARSSYDMLQLCQRDACSSSCAGDDVFLCD